MVNQDHRKAYGSSTYRVLFTVIALSSGLTSTTAAAEGLTGIFTLRATPWETAAKAAGLDPLLLYAVGLVESRTIIGNDRAITAPHPWTLNSPEGGEYFHTREAAATRLKILLEKYRSVDIGYLQINLKWNGHRVGSPFDLLDPRTNLRTGAMVLAEAMRSAPNDLELGIGRYHQWGEANARDYGRKVLRVLRVLRTLSERDRLASNDLFWR